MGRAVVEAGLCGCELVLNDRVGVTSHDPADWRDPARVATNVERFWSEFEAAFGALRLANPVRRDAGA